MKATMGSILIVTIVSTWFLLIVATRSKAVGEKEKKPFSTEVIHRVWKSRQARVKSLKVAWTDQRLVSKGSISRLNEIAVRKKPKQLVPKEDVVEAVKMSLSLESGKMRHAFEGPQWSEEKQQFVPQQYISTYDGKTSRYYWPPGAREGNGAILSRNNNKDVNTIHVMPLLLNYRFFNSAMINPRFQELSFLGERGLVGDRVCLIMKENVKQTRSATSYSFWIDPERDYIIRRLNLFRKNELSLQMDIDYSKDPQFGWVPSGWQMKRPAKGDSWFISHTALVTGYQFNIDFDIAEFYLQFPPGSRVYDEHSDKHYIVMDDGAQRVITDDEAALTYKQLMEKQPKRSRFFPVVIIVLTVVILFIVARRIRRRRRPQAQL